MKIPNVRGVQKKNITIYTVQESTARHFPSRIEHTSIKATFPRCL